MISFYSNKKTDILVVSLKKIDWKRNFLWTRKEDNLAKLVYTYTTAFKPTLLIALHVGIDYNGSSYYSINMLHRNNSVNVLNSKPFFWFYKLAGTMKNTNQSTLFQFIHGNVASLRFSRDRGNQFESKLG
jgi:hypothetical protein